MVTGYTMQQCNARQHRYVLHVNIYMNYYSYYYNFTLHHHFIYYHNSMKENKTPRWSSVDNHKTLDSIGENDSKPPIITPNADNIPYHQLFLLMWYTSISNSQTINQTALLYSLESLACFLAVFICTGIQAQAQQ